MQTTDAGDVNLRRDGAILLVSCYEMGRPPQGIAWPMAFLERAGYAPAALDVAVEGLDAAKLGAARFAGISASMHTALLLGVRVARELRRVNPGCHICFHGTYALLNAGYLRREVADSVLGGECEEELVERVRALEHGAQAVDRVALGHLDFPVPSRDRLPSLERYARLEHEDERRLAGYVEASRGCLHRCRHCQIPPLYGGRFFAVPAPVVLADIGAQVQAGATHISFGDPDFLNGPAHALRVVRAMHAEFPHVTFDITAKVQHVVEQRALVPELATLGCLFVVTAVESLSDEVLACLRKEHTRADVVTALGILRAAGIAVRPSFVPFTPWEKLEGYLELLGFVEGEGLVEAVDPVQLSLRLLVPPGSLLLDSPDMQPFLGLLAEESLSYEWKHPDPRMDALQREVHDLVERAAAQGEDASVTFAKIRALAPAAAGTRRIPAAVAPTATESSRARRRPPRLTEPWFC